MEIILVSLLNGFVYGMLLFMLASGLTLIFSMMGVLRAEDREGLLHTRGDVEKAIDSLVHLYLHGVAPCIHDRNP